MKSRWFFSKFLYVINDLFGWKLERGVSIEIRLQDGHKKSWNSSIRRSIINREVLYDGASLFFANKWFISPKYKYIAEVRLLCVCVFFWLVTRWRKSVLVCPHITVILPHIRVFCGHRKFFQWLTFPHSLAIVTHTVRIHPYI